METATTTVNNRYQLQSRLGSGGMGEVYRAYDRLRDEVVALKRVLLETDPPDGLARAQNTDPRVALAREFRVLASLRHPNIISVLDYGFDMEQQPFFTMTYLPNAVDFETAWPSLDSETAIAYLLQSLQGVAYLHQRGLLHRDIKPANILINDGQVKLIDFGLAAAPDQFNPVAGTITNIAPEVLAGQIAGPAADLYAVGLVAYFAVAGDFPFDTRQALPDLMHDILLSEPDLSLLPGALAPVIGKLLAKEPADRYASAYDTIAALCAALDWPVPPETEEIRESYLQAATFVGRQPELATLQDALDVLLTRQQGSAWLVGGESGVGKSRLLEEIRTQALVDGIVVVEGNATEAGPPYQLWRDVLPHLVLSSNISPQTAHQLQPLVPFIAQLVDFPLPDSDAASAPVEQINAAILTLIRQQHSPLLLLLEDLHHIRESLAPLNHLLQSMDELPVVVIGTYRSDETPDLPRQITPARHLLLERLSRAEIATLSEAMAGPSTNQAELVRLLERETEGNVFFLVEIMRALAEEAGRLNQVGQGQLPQTIITGGIQQITRRRIERISPADRPLLALAAVAGRTIDRDVLAQLSNSQSVEDWLIRCGEQAVLEVHENEWRFTHDKIRAASLAQLDPAELADHHARVAQAIEAAYPDAEAQAAALADHWTAAGDYDRALDYTLRYLEQLHQLSAFFEIQATVNRRLEQTAHTADPQTYRRRLLMLGANAEEKLGHYQRAVQMYQQALGIARQQAAAQDEIAALLGMGLTAYWQADFATARTHTEAALARSRDLDDEARLAEALKQMGGIITGEGDYLHGIDYLQQSLGLFRQRQDRPNIARLLHDLGESYLAVGEYEQALHALQESLHMFRALSDRRGLATAQAIIARLLIYRADFNTATRYCTASLTAFREMGYQRAIGGTLVGLGIIETERGDFDTAMDYFQEGSIIFRQTGNRLGLANMLVELAELLRRQGQYHHARLYFEESQRLIQAASTHESVPYALLGLGTLALDHNQLQEAEPLLNDALGRFRDLQDRFGQARTLGRLGQLAYIQGDSDAALTVYHQGLDIARAANIHLPLMKLLVAVAFPELELGQLDDARQHLRQGIERAVQVPVPLVVLHGMIGVGRLQALAGQLHAAARLAGLVSNHPLTTPALQQYYARPLMTVLREQMPLDDLNDALSQGKSADFNAMVAGVLGFLRQQANGR